MCSSVELARQEEVVPFANSQHGALQSLSTVSIEFLRLQTSFLLKSSHPSPLTLAVPLVDEKLIALLAAAFKAAHCVAANVVTASIVQAALVYVWASRTKQNGR